MENSDSDGKFVVHPKPPQNQSSNTNPRVSKKQNTQKVEEKNEDDEESKYLDDLTQRALDGEDISDCPTYQLPDLIGRLNDLHDNLIAEGEFDASEVADIATKRTKELLSQRMKVNALNDRKEYIQQRLAQAKTELKDLERQIAAQERNMNIKLKRQTMHLQAKQNEEVEDFIKEWESPEHQRRYNRSSPFLRDLRAQEKLLLNDHRYDEMRSVKRRADDIEQKEIDSNYRRMEADFAESFKFLQKKQKMEREKTERAQQAKRCEYESAKKFDLSVLERRIIKLKMEMETVKDGDRYWNLHHRNDGDPTARAPRSDRNKGKKPIYISEFNTLALPKIESIISARSVERKQNTIRASRTARAFPKRTTL